MCRKCQEIKNDTNRLQRCCWNNRKKDHQKYHQIIQKFITIFQDKVIVFFYWHRKILKKEYQVLKIDKMGLFFQIRNRKVELIATMEGFLMSTNFPECLDLSSMSDMEIGFFKCQILRSNSSKARVIAKVFPNHTFHKMCPLISIQLYGIRKKRSQVFKTDDEKKIAEIPENINQNWDFCCSNIKKIGEKSMFVCFSSKITFSVVLTIFYHFWHFSVFKNPLQTIWTKMLSWIFSHGF